MQLLRVLMHLRRLGRVYLALAWAAAVLQAPPAAAGGVLGDSPETTYPVNAGQSATPLVMLTMSRDHTLFFPAYDDVSDLDGDGIIDFRFKPTFEYLGLYNPYYCYAYSGSGNGGLFAPPPDPNDGIAVPTIVGGKKVPGPCVSSGQSSYWSGNFLNYVTTSRIDALRIVLYGGYRETDTATTASGTGSTILRRAYIPQDGHAWAKEYTSYLVDGYYINQYTPLAQPSTDRRHFFGNLTSTLDALKNGNYSYSGNDYPPKGKSCSTLNDCSDYPPLIRVITNSDKRVWQWASSQRPVLNNIAYPKLWNDINVTSYGAGTLSEYTVRVSVCTAGYTNGCKAYVSGGYTTYKPTGVLHDYGENGSMDFGLLTGSYDTNMSGGRLRKNISSFAAEVNANGTFAYPTNSLVKQINNLRIRNFNNQSIPNNYFENFVYKNGNTQRNRVMEQGIYGDWGNPVAEMMYESLRYFAGKSGPTGAYDNGTKTDDDKVGLDKPSWVDPYSTTNWCAKPSTMVISSTNPSFDSDQLPGSYYQSAAFTDNFSDANSNALNVETLTTTIGAAEGITGKFYFIGESGTDRNYAPTAKKVDNLGQVRGLPPDETNSQGSFYAAAVANFGRSKTLRKLGGNSVSGVDTYAIALNSPLMKITIPWSGVSIVPFARSISDNIRSNAGTISNAKQDFQPTNQLVGGYVQSMAVDTTAKTYSLTFIVNWEDSSWGNDFEMDVMTKYEITATATTTTVKVTPLANVVGGVAQNMGFTISGTTKDGVYLVAQSDCYGDGNGNGNGYCNGNGNGNNNNNYISYFLNVPAGLWAGACDVTPPPAACRGQMPYPGDSNNGQATSSRLIRFDNSSNASAAYLSDPLYYAAKWGGYKNDDSPPTAATAATWVVDTYARVTSAAKLRTAFATAFQNVLDRSGTVGAVSTSSQQVQNDTQVYRATFNAKNGSGELLATPLDTSARVIKAENLTSTWKASDYLLHTATRATERNIWFKNPSTAAGVDPLLPFTYSNLPSSYTSSYLTSEDMVKFLRGDPSGEMSSGTGSYRNRTSVLGSIVNSEPYYSEDTKMVYVGANDGMLHAFDSATGVERFAYIPTALIPNLSALSSANWSHRYYVDGNIAMSDNKAKTSGNNYLVAMLGRGGKGLFGLRVALNSSSVFAPTSAWENFGSGDNDMGYLTGQPLIEYLADGTSVVVFGNGYNSTNQQAVLYVVKLSDGSLLQKFTTSTGSAASPNGLATPGLRRDSGKLQYAYAGDYLGNVWRFDLRSLTGSSSGTTAGVKMFTATTAAGAVQHITAPLTVSYSYNPPENLAAILEKWYVLFGTGSTLTASDALDSSAQTLYGLIEQGTYPPTIVRSDLMERTIDTITNAGTGVKTAATGTIEGLTVRSFGKPTSGDMAGKKGWRMDWLTNGTSPSERVVTAVLVRDGWIPTALVSSMVPQSSGCNTSGAGYLNAVDAYRGGGLDTSFFDMNNDKSFNETFTYGGATKVPDSIDFNLGSFGAPSVVGDYVLVNAQKGIGNEPVPPNTVRSGRISWREIVAP